MWGQADWQTSLVPYLAWHGLARPLPLWQASLLVYNTLILIKGHSLRRACLCVPPPRLFEMYDLRMDFDLNAVADLARALADTVLAFVRLALDNPEDDVLGGLSALYLQKSAGKVRA